MHASPRIRVLGTAVPRDGDRVLVERCIERPAGRVFYRAIGGGVDFGERAIDTAVREWREELDVTLEPGVLLGVLENIFVYQGAPGHEVVFVYEARVAESWVYDRSSFDRTEPDGLRHDAVWVSLDELRDGLIPLYPDGLAALLLGTRSWPTDSTQP